MSLKKIYFWLILYFQELKCFLFQMFYRGIVMAVVAGTLYGLNFTPVIAYKDNHPEASQNGISKVHMLVCIAYCLVIYSRLCCAQQLKCFLCEMVLRGINMAVLFQDLCVEDFLKVSAYSQ